MPADTAKAGTVSERSIASDLLEYLQNNPGVCANGNVHGWAWIRYHDGDWQATRYASSSDRLKSYVVGDVLDEEAVLDWLESKPVSLIPATEAYLWRPAEETVWEDADEQDVFADYDRCFWCGGSERTHELSVYQTVENGECKLCPSCRESWDSADEIVRTTTEATA